MKRWVSDNNLYQLMFELGYDEECVLQFTIDEYDDTFYWYRSPLLQVEHELIITDSIEEAMREFECMVRAHFEDEIAYWNMLLKKWDEED